MDIEGRTAVVTGASGGIGSAIAALLRDRGATVVGWDRDDSSDVRVDITDQEDVVAAVRTTIERAGVPEIVVLAAGIHARAAFEDTPLEDFDRVIGVNLRGMYSCMQELVKEMKAHRTGAAFVLIGSLSGVLSDPMSVPYSLSKIGVNQLGRIAAVELAPFGIRVNVVNPGPIETDMIRRNLSVDSYRQLVVDTTPLGRVGTPADVAPAVAAFIELDWVTGQAICVDGGSSLVTPRGAARGSLGDYRAGGQGRAAASRGDADEA